MGHKVQIVDENNRQIKVLDAAEGEMLHHVLIHEQGYHAPCGGNGTCKKCKVRIMNDIPFTSKEKSLLNDEEINQGIHFACELIMSEDITVELKRDNRYQIAQDIYEETGSINPIIKRTIVTLSELKKNIRNDYITTLKQGVGVSEISLEAVRKLPELILSNDTEIMVVHDDKKILNVSGKIEEGFGIATDIGTTTIVSYLYNLSTGKYIDVISEINHQKNFGFDVIARIKHAHETEGLEELNTAIVSQLNIMIDVLLKRNGITCSQLDEFVVAGNTVMIHLLLKTNPKDIGVAPFTPVITEAVYEEAAVIGLKGAKHSRVVVLPSVAAYVGADIVSGMIATNFQNPDKRALLIDIGTNGEIALLNKDEIVCCATAAGPAFEGANISCGVGGIAGAINKVYNNEGRVEYTTIHDETPIGLCGSGLIDAVAVLLESGCVDETGYMDSDDLIEIDDMPAYEIVKKEEGSSSICITQKDIREIQLAKGSIRAGIDTMLYESGLTAEMIDEVYIAGGFGSYMDKESAVRIGLLPAAVKDKLISVGNSAGIGAIKVLLDKQYLNISSGLKEKCRYIELSNSVKFMDYYMESMSF